MIIAIEGTDATGKQTQVKALEENLKKLGYDVEQVSFPRYESPASVFEQNYLNGVYSPDPFDLSAKEASLFFSLDRYDYFKKREKEPEILLTDRYTTSNLLHQGAKLDKESRKEYSDWLKDLEYNTLSIPKPDMVFFLNMPEDFSEALLKHRHQENDIHEKNKAYKDTISDRALEIAREEGWSIIDCVKDNKLRSIEDIQEEILEKVKRNV